MKCESPDGARVTPEGHEERRSLRPVGARAGNPWFDPQSLDFKATGRRAPDIVFDAAHLTAPCPGGANKNDHRGAQPELSMGAKPGFEL